MPAGLRLMCVHAHPDDESSKGAATMAKYVDAGDVLNPKLKDDPAILRDLAQVRRDEMRAAQEILGVRHTWLGFVDSGLPEGDPLPPLPEGCFALEPLEIPVEALVREIRRFRPHVVTTYDERGGYPHPDHIRCHDVSTAAFDAAGDPERFPGAGEAWQPLKLYYNGGFSRQRIESYHQALLDLGIESPYGEWLAQRGDWPQRRVTTCIHCADWFERRDRALLAHATQIDPDGWFFSVPRDVQAKVWPFDDYEAAASVVPIVEVEDDLFAGIPADLAAADALALGRPALAYDERVARAVV